MVSSYHCMWGFHEIKTIPLYKGSEAQRSQGLTSWKWQSQDTNRGYVASEFVFLSMTWHCLSIAQEMKKVLCRKIQLVERELEVVLVVWDFKSWGQGRSHWETDIQDLNGAREAIWGKVKCKGTEAWCVQGTERRLVWLEWRYWIVRDKTGMLRKGMGGGSMKMRLHEAWQLPVRILIFTFE